MTSFRVELDVARFADTVEGALRFRKISARELAKVTGVPASTLTRMKSGSGMSVDAFLSLCAWLGVDATTFVREKS